MAVTGRVAIKDLKRNDTAVEDCQLFITKPLGVGILSTAQKQGKLGSADVKIVDSVKCRDIILKIYGNAKEDLCIKYMDIPEEYYK